MSELIAPWLVSAKVSPPRLFVSACRRSNLLDQLLAGDCPPIVMVEAPAGFGKTLLLSQWREELKKSSRHVGWISIDHSDEPDIFVPYLAYAFHRDGLDMLSTGLLSPSFHGMRTAYSLGRLLNNIENAKQSCVLVFDDFENTSDELLNEVLEPLLRMQPDNLQLVFACRHNPGLSLSNLAVQGGLLTLGPQQLKFSKMEIEKLFEQVKDSSEIDFIVERTGGWPVALQLLRSFGHELPSEPSKLNDFSGSSKDVAIYFREQLFLKLQEDEKTFLQDTAILDPVWINCADAIRDKIDSHEIMQRLSYLEGIFAPLENDEQAYRLHPLVREYFYEELKENNYDRYIHLNRSAAKWFSEENKKLTAIRYALSADDEDLAGEIFEDMGGPRLWFEEGMARISIGLDLLEGREMNKFPRVQLARSLRYTKNGDVKKAREYYEYAARLSDGFKRDRPGRDEKVLYIDGYFIETILIEYGCTPSMRLLKTQALDFVLENAIDEWMSRGYVRLIQCVTHLQAGDFEQSRQFGEMAIEAYREGNSLYGELFIYFHFGMAQLAQADTQGALEQYGHGLKITRAEFPGDKGLQWIGHVLQGELFWGMGDASNARKHLRYVIRHLNQLEAWFDIYMAAYQAVTQYLLHESGYEAAVAFLDKVQQHANEQELLRLEIVIIALRVTLAYLAGQQEQLSINAKALDNIIKKNPRSDIHATLQEVEVISSAKIYAAMLENDETTCGILIEELLVAGQNKGHKRIAIYALIQRAILRQKKDTNTEAIKDLVGALDLAVAGNYIRPFLLERKNIQGILEQIQDSYIGNQDKESEKRLYFIKQILSDSSTKMLESLSSPFSNRELEILSELSKGQPDKVIARSLGLTAHGVRYHLKNIYGKMGVKNRLQAISKARESGLVCDN